MDDFAKEVITKMETYKKRRNDNLISTIWQLDFSAALQEELSKSQAATVNAEKFMGIVRKHLAFEELTPHPLAGND